MTKVPFSKPMFYSKSKLTLAIAAQMLVITPAWTAPTGGEIVGGTGSIEQQGTETTIVQNTDRLAIDWQGFDVGKNERVKFVQPGQSAVALNRILGNKGSEILGRIDANGHVILVNPNGVIFGQGAVVNAGGLIASGLQINPDDFMNGDLAFKRIEGADGTIINSGMINAAAGGNVVLLGKQVENRGLISARLGSVLLASGEEAVLTFDESGLLGVQVDKATLQNEIGSSAAVANSGEIRAENGRVLLSAATTRNVFSQAVNWGEHRQAQSVAYNEDGSFTLGAGGDVINSGAISTSGEGAGDVVVLGENITLSGTIHADAVDGKAGYVELHSNGTTIVSGRGIVTANGEQGGDIKLLGKNVGLMDRSAVEAMGTAGGGVVLVGGDREGLNSRVRNSDFVYINKDAFVNVSATDDGDGGTAIIFAEDTARVYGSLSSRGGKYVGNGGFIETSGKRGFEVSQTPDIGAVNGEGGHWLIDPHNITIGAGGEGRLDNDNVFESTPDDARIAVVTIVDALVDGATVTIKTGDKAPSNEKGNITIDTNIEFEKSKTTATLNLVAHNDIVFDENASITAKNDTNSHLNVNLNANTSGEKGRIFFGKNVTINTNGGDFKIAGDPVNNANDPAPGAYNIDLTNLTIDVGGGNFVAHAENKLTRHQDFEIQNGNLTLGAAEWEFSAPGSPPALISTGNGNIFFFTGGELRLPSIKSTGDITLSVRDTKENGEFKVHNERQSENGWRDFSLGGTLTLNLGSQGIAKIYEIQRIEGVEGIGKMKLVVASDRMDQGPNGPRVDLQTSPGVILGEVAVDGDFFLEAGGAITQEGEEGLNIRGQSKFSSNQLTLDNLKNSFAKAVSIGGSANTVVLKAEENLMLARSTEGNIGSLDVEASGHIRQDGALKVDNIILSAKDVTLNEGENNFEKLSIGKAESAKIVDSGGLELTAVNVLGKLELSGISTLTQSGALSVGELALDIDGAALSGNENRIGTLSGSVHGGELNVQGPLKIGNFTVGNTSPPALFNLTLSGEESSLTQSNSATLTIGSGVVISASDVELNSSIRLRNEADLAINDVRTFILNGAVRGDWVDGNSLTVNGVSGQESNYEIKHDASWKNITFHIDGGGAGVLQGPDLNNNWSIQSNGAHELSAGGQKLSFEKMKVLKGGSATDKWDYSNYFSNVIDLSNLPYFSELEDKDIVNGSRSQTLKAPSSTNNTWTIGDLNTISMVTPEKTDGDSGGPEVLREIKFQGFTNLQGGSGVDEFIVELDGQGTDGSIPNYELYGGEGKSSLRIIGGTDEWSGAYGVSQNQVGQNDRPEFTFSFSKQERIKVGYQEIEDINLEGNLKQMKIKGLSENDEIQFGAGWWEIKEREELGVLKGYGKVIYGDGLQGLIVDGNGGSISLAADMNDRPPKAIQFSDSLTLQNATLFDGGIQLQTTNLHLKGLQGGIGKDDSPLIISVDSLELTNNAGNIYIRELDGVSLGEVSGVGDDKLIDLEVTAGNLSQDSAITMSSGSLYLRAKSGNIVLDNDNNKINVPISLSASGWASVYTKGSLELGEVDVNSLNLRAEGGISSGERVVVKGETQLVSGGDIRFDNRCNDFWSVPTEENNFGGVSIEAVGGGQVSVNLVDENELKLKRINISGGLEISAQKLLFSDLTNVRTLKVNAGEVVVKQLVLAEGDVVFNNPDNVTEAPKITGAGLIHSEHGLIFGVRTLTAADQMIEIETLAEIDPAIFTNVKNYFHQDVSVLLPADQRYDDSDEEDSLAEIDPEFFTDVKNYSYQDVSVQLPLDQL